MDPASFARGFVLGLTSAAAALRARITPGLLHGINLASGIVIGAFGLVAIVLAIRG